MASEVSICNLAMDILGAARIVDLTEDSVNGRACNGCYAELRDAELQAHPWNFARKRAVLASDTAAPAFDYGYAFTLPADCLRVLLPARAQLDWLVEGGKILTNDGTSIHLLYVRRVTDPAAMDVTYRYALAARMGLHLCEKITQSNTKKADARTAYKDAIAEARRTNAMQRTAEESPDDPWDTARN